MPPGVWVSDTAECFGPFVLDRRQHRLWRQGDAVELPPRAFALLLLLTSDPGVVFSRGALMDALWSEHDEVSEGALSQLVLVLRRGLGPQGRDFIRTVAKSGYAFSGQLQPMPRPEIEQRPQPLPAPALVDETDQTAGAPGGATGNRRAIGLLGLGLALVALVMLAAWLGQTREASLPGQALAFEGIATATDDDAALRHSALALHELIAAELRGRPGVVLRRPEDIIGQGALEERYRLGARLGNSPDSDTALLRLDWRLIGPAGEQTWSQDLQRDRLFEGVDSVLKELGTRLPDLGSTLRRPLQSPSEPALLAFAQAHRAQAERDLPAARAGFERALALAPDFVMARHALAEVLSQLGYRDLAVSHAREALAALDPAQSTYPLLAHRLLSLQNLHEKAVLQARQLSLREPADIEWRLLVVGSLISAGDLEAAGRELDALLPDALPPRWRGRWLLQRYRLAVAQGDVSEARTRAQALADYADAQGLNDLSAEARALLADAAVRSSDYASASELLDDAARRFDRLGVGASAVRACALRLQVSDWAGRPQALEDYRALRDAARALGNPELEAGAEFALANFHASRMDFRSQRTHLLASRDLLQRIAPHPWQHVNNTALARNESQVGRLDAAWELLEQLKTLAGGQHTERWRTARSRALTRQLQNRLGEAIELAHGAHRLATEAGLDGAFTLECEAWSMAAQWQGADPDAAAGALDSCVTRLAVSDQPQDLAWQVLVRSARALLMQASNPEQAAQELRSSLKLADGIGEDERMDLLPSWPLMLAAGLPPDEALPAIDALLALRWAEGALREQALLHGLRCVLLALSPGSHHDSAAAACTAALTVAPSQEGLVGELIALGRSGRDAQVTGPHPSPSTPPAQGEAGGHRALLLLEQRLRACGGGA